MRRIALLTLTVVVLLAAIASAADVTFVHRASGAKEVYLAGSFNGWSAFDLAMKDTGGGVWSVVMSLDPGEHQYKFVVDGSWTQDKGNAASVEDGYGGQNSVVVVPEGATELVAGGGEKPAGAAPVVAAAPSAGSGATSFAYDAGGSVVSCCVAGEFNDWNPTADAMSDDDGDGVYTVSLDLAAGQYMYKFVVDGNWFSDATAAESVDDGFGGQNSVVVVGTTAGGAAPAAAGGDVQVIFAYDAGGAVGSCYVAGDFNGWNPTGDAMNDGDGDGVYTCVLSMPPGQTTYKFVVDGNWLQDPTNAEGIEDGFGGQNSVLDVPPGVATFAAGGAEPVAAATPAVPAVAVAPAVTGDGIDVTFDFTPVISGVTDVFLAGAFNGWDPAADRMSDPDEDGTYSLVKALAPGQYAYKFVVDGEWMADPGNANVEEDGFGGSNSVLIVKHGADPFAAVDTKGPGAPAVGMRTVKFAHAAGKSAGEVFLAGTFNDWNDSKQRMSDADGDGVFETTLLLQPGNYQYKFVVDGQWTQDPNNPNGTEDGFGGQNSILEVDDSFEAVKIELGDGRIFSDDLEPIFDYSTCNPLSETEVEITARAHLDDVETVTLRYRTGGGDWQDLDMTPAETDPAFQYYRARLEVAGLDEGLDYTIRYQDAEAVAVLGREGIGDDTAAPFHYDSEVLPPFLTPDWARDGVVYQIFPERFRNGDKSNDPDFSEPWYQGANTLPASGKTNGEYFHMVDDWTDVAGLSRSPYRTDGRPDYYSFYGGDIAGVREKLDYLNDLGITVIYFNPLNQGMSNHKYDPTDYNTVDPHFASETEFKAFVKDAHEHGIRIVVDMAFNHTGNWHFAFRDGADNGRKSEYYDWYEWHKWPLPASRDFNAGDYYDCWWGFGLHPNLNFDLTRPNNAENNIGDISQADPNMPVVDHVLGVARYWLGELGIDGFRLDVPNEVPFWFWKLFNEECHKIKPDCWLVGEIWGNAGSWIGPNCFDSTMNYKYFRDPVMEFFGQGRIEARVFDQRLAPGRFVYPPQSVQVMMNLMDSHDTIRFLTSAKDVRRLMLGALFSMSYVGMPHIWYGNEVGMTGGKDPDCRRPMDWAYEQDADKVALRDFYGTITRYRRDHQVLSRGDFVTMIAEGRTYGFARVLDGKSAVSLFNADTRPVTFTLEGDALKAALPEGGGTVFKVVVGTDWFPNAESGSLTSGETLELGHGTVDVTLPPLSGALLAN